MPRNVKLAKGRGAQRTPAAVTDLKLALPQRAMVPGVAEPGSKFHIGQPAGDGTEIVDPLRVRRLTRFVRTNELVGVVHYEVRKYFRVPAGMGGEVEITGGQVKCVVEQFGVNVNLVSDLRGVRRPAVGLYLLQNV